MTKQTRKSVIHSVFASLDECMPKGKEFAAFQCDSCLHVFAANKELAHPVCIECGSPKTAKAETKAEDTVENLENVPENEMAAIKCPNDGCGAFNILSDVHAKALDGSLNCVCCGTNIKFEAETLDEDLENIDETVDEVSEEVTEEETVSDDDGEDLGGDEVVEEDEVSEDVDTEEVPEGDELTMSLNLLDLVESASDKKHISFTRIGKDKIVAFYNDISIATLYSDKVPEETRNLFSSDVKYLEALSNRVNTHGLRNTLEDFGFTIANVQAPVAKFNKLQTAKDDQTIQAAVEAQKTHLVKDFKAAMGLAAAGLTKNFWKGVENPLKQALAEKLKTIGVKNPEKVIRDAFISKHDQYAKVLIEQAIELMDRPVEVRNALSQSLSGVEYTEQTDDDEGDDIENALDQPFTTDAATVEVRSSTEEKTQVHASIADVRAKNGGRLFSRNLN